MALLRRREEVVEENLPTITPEQQVVEIEEPADEQPERNWLMLAALIAAGLAVAILLILAGRWIYNSITDNDSGSKIPSSSNITPAAGTKNMTPYGEGAKGNSSTQTTPSSPNSTTPLPSTGG